VRLDPITEAAHALAAGGVVCIPTESTYGLAADIRSGPALYSLGILKQTRPADAPYPLIAPDLAAARALARVWPDAAEELARRLWPGPLTLVVPARSDLPSGVVGPDGGVGVRVSSHPLAAALVGTVGAPITATSANRSGTSPATTVAEARAIFGGEVACYLDGGPCEGTPSTVVAVDETGALRIIRRGAIDLSP
jgi:L-threonylcarbamoyladenylate synthase